MTARTAIIIWLVAALLLPVMGAVGALFKIQHWPFAWFFEVVGWLFSAAMSMVLVLKVLRYPGFKDFLDR
jgi:hypothetical protein